MKEVQIDPSWQAHLSAEFEKEYFKKLSDFVHKEYNSKQIFPNPKNIFRAFDTCPFEEVKVVILGQDPYHGDGQAIGLSFAVPEDVDVPPSLRNIFKEIESDLGQKLVHTDGNLERWASQGVLLLNATLTVQAHIAGSHQGHGWEQFTDAAIRALSDEREHLVFILWGNYAKAKGAHIDRTRHLVIESAHPSPLSAHNGFLGSRPFSKANAYLTEHEKTPIKWL
jgi:uracil-DNA glycosylase